MRLHDVARSAARARKAYARAIATQGEDMTAKAARRLERRAKASRRAMLESLRGAELLADWEG